MMMTPKEKPAINLNTVLLVVIITLFGFFTMASSKWVDNVENHLITDTAWSQQTEVRLTKVESHQTQTLEALAEIKQILKSRTVCQQPS